MTMESNSVLMKVAFPRPDCPWEKYGYDALTHNHHGKMNGLFRKGSARVERWIGRILQVRQCGPTSTVLWVIFLDVAGQEAEYF